MEKFDLNQVNWSKIWEEGVVFFIGQAEKSNSWDQAASRWNEVSQKDIAYRDEVIHRLKLQKEWTLLDVGCGTGLLAIPLAKKVKKVTALDSSGEMLRYCKENATREKITNVEYVHKKIEETIIGKDIEKHDVVIACRSMGHEHDLRKFLIALNNSTNRFAYLTWGASDRHFDIELHTALGRKYGETRTYIIIFNLLYQLGIRANIEIFECPQTGMSYPNPDEAAEQLIRRFKNMKMDRELSKEEETRLCEFLQKRLQKQNDGTYIYPISQTAKNALIWWEKSADIPIG